MSSKPTIHLTATQLTAFPTSDPEFVHHAHVWIARATIHGFHICIHESMLFGGYQMARVVSLQSVLNKV